MLTSATTRSNLAHKICAPLAIRCPEFGTTWIGRYLEKTKSYSLWRLIVELTLIATVLDELLWNVLILSSWGAACEGLDRLLHALARMPGAWILIILVGPVFETILFQLIPIKMMSLFTSRSGVLVIVSAVIFALWHANRIQSVGVIPAGLILGYVFVMKGRESLQTAVCVTSAIHMLHNAIWYGRCFL
jgi:membrane protease YdiL (CAAX protease family)